MKLKALALVLSSSFLLLAPSCSDDSSKTDVGGVECSKNADCDDKVDCTEDTCTQGKCANTPDDTACGAGEFCRGAQGCFLPPICSGEADPSCDDGEACTTDSCDPATGRCTYTPNNGACSDDAFCNGEEICVPWTGCIPGAPPDCDDGIDCTVDRCDETADACDPQAEDRLCGDGNFCNGTEICNVTAGGCEQGVAPDCDDANDCTDDVCDSVLNACIHTVRDGDNDGEPDRLCGGADCDDTDPDKFSANTETCNGEDENCNGVIDEGVLSECGNCDLECRQTTTGTTPGSTTGFKPTGLVGTELSANAGGLIVVPVSQASNDLWVPNTAESTLSRWDASTATEIARYYVGYDFGECPARCCWDVGCNMPSRVVVDSEGNAYVANRGFGIQGSVTKVAADLADCVDRNQNGRIDTSSTAFPMPWGDDECILWHAAVGPSNAVLRAIAVDLGDEAHPEGYPWVGGYNSRMFWKLNPDDGTVIAGVSSGNLNPYGAVVLKDGKLWVGALGQGATGWIDTTTTSESFQQVNFPAFRGCAGSYGITADGRGRLWFSGWACADAIGHDPSTGEWTRVPAHYFSNMTAGRGITVDDKGVVWMAVGGDGQSHVAFWHSDLFTPGGDVQGIVSLVRLPPGHSGPSGVGADAQGFIWVGHHVTSQLVRLDSRTGQMETFTGPNRIYTYSDFTGAVRRAIVGRGFYVEDHDAGCDNPTWNELDWVSQNPAETLVTFRIRTAASASTAAALDFISPVDVAAVPPDSGPVDLESIMAGAGVTHGRFLRMSIELETTVFGLSPVVSDYTLTWHCAP